MATTAFISYSHADEKHLERLHKHLAVLRREGLITWTDHQVIPGDNLDDEVIAAIDNSEIFVALISAEYLDSRYCYEKEFRYASSLHEAGKIRLVSVILEPCDWLNSPLKEFLVLPKEGKPISIWTNQNNAYLDVVNGLRRAIEAPRSATRETIAGVTTGRRPRVKQDFDAIQKVEFANKAFETIKSYFQSSCDELNGISDSVRAKFEEMSKSAFTCTVVNRGKSNGCEAHVTFHNSRGRDYFGSNISYVFQAYAATGTANGFISVEADDYNLFLTLDAMSYQGGDRGKRYTPEQAAEIIWGNFVKQAGVEYE